MAPSRRCSPHEGVEIGVQGGNALGVVAQAAVDGDGRPVAGLEELAEVGGPREPVHVDGLPAGVDVGDAIAEELVDVLLVPPQRWRLRPGRRRGRVGLHRGEHPAHESLRSPVDQPDRAAGAADAQHFVRGRLVVRGEHDADARHHDVELAVREGQRLRVRLPPLQPGAPHGGQVPPDLQQLGSEVGRHHVGPGQGGRNGRVAGARPDVEDAVARPYTALADQQGAQLRDDVGGDRRVVAHRPHRAVLGLQGAVGLDRIARLGHDSRPPGA